MGSGVKLVVGLGNPGGRYRGTRHNVGYRVVETLAERARIVLDEERYDGRFGQGRVAGIPVALLLPETFMNESGGAVVEALRGLGLSDPGRDLLVVLDDIDLPLGRLRLRPGGGDGGQRGLRDILHRLGREDIARLRFGVGRPPEGVDPTRWVLAGFDRTEEAVLRRALPRAADAVASWLSEGIATAMDRFNGPWPESTTGGPSADAG